jgi:hypothetical protein
VPVPWSRVGDRRSCSPTWLLSDISGDRLAPFSVV